MPSKPKKNDTPEVEAIAIPDTPEVIDIPGRNGQHMDSAIVPEATKPTEPTEPTDEELYADWRSTYGGLVRLTPSTLAERMDAYMATLAESPITAEIDDLKAEIALLAEKLATYELAELDDDMLDLLKAGVKTRVAGKQAEIAKLESRDESREAFLEHVIYPMFQGGELPARLIKRRGTNGKRAPSTPLDSSKAYAISIALGDNRQRSTAGSLEAAGFMVGANHPSMANFSLSKDKLAIFTTEGLRMGDVIFVGKSKTEVIASGLGILGGFNASQIEDVRKSGYGPRNLKESPDLPTLKVSETRREIAEKTVAA